MPDSVAHFRVKVRSPVRTLDGRGARHLIIAPFPLIRELRGHQPEARNTWGKRLAEHGWEWACSADDCWPSSSVNFPREMVVIPQDLDPRPLVLAASLRMKLNGIQLGVVSRDESAPEHPPDLESSWRFLQGISADELADVLSLALFERDGAGVFDFRALAPNWPADLKTVCIERQSLPRLRQPRATWLAEGYKLLEQLGDLHNGADSISYAETMLEALTEKKPLPAGFHLAWWWEVIYVLSEQQRFSECESAEKRLASIAARLVALSGLVNPLWTFQRGRLFYYAGRLGDAAGLMMRQLAAPSDPLAEAMLLREAANVFSDLGCLDAATSLIERSITCAREQGNDAEIFKSLGRHGEILLKLGRLPEAQEAFGESLGVQRRLPESEQRLAQTLTYLAHTSSMMGLISEANAGYANAELEDTLGGSLPYITMGRFALAARTDDGPRLHALWSGTAYSRTESIAHPTHVLCAAVCCTAAANHVPEAKQQLPQYVGTLVNSNYAIEALFPILMLASSEAAPLIRDAMEILRSWQKTLKTLPEHRLLSGMALNGPSRIQGAFDQLLRSGGSPPHDVLRLTYPMSLLLRVSLDRSA